MDRNLRFMRHENCKMCQSEGDVRTLGRECVMLGTLSKLLWLMVRWCHSNSTFWTETLAASNLEKLPPHQVWLPNPKNCSLNGTSLQGHEKSKNLKILFFTTIQSPSRLRRWKRWLDGTLLFSFKNVLHKCSLLKQRAALFALIFQCVIFQSSKLFG